MKNRTILIGVLAITIAAGIASCAKNNKEDILKDLGTVCDTTSTGYAAEIQPILAQHCATSGCHTTATVAGGYNLETYTTVKDAVLGPRFMGSINHSTGFSPMPKGKDKLSDCDIQKITIWKAKGAQNN